MFEGDTSRWITGAEAPVMVIRSWAAASPRNAPTPMATTRGQGIARLCWRKKPMKARRSSPSTHSITRQ